MFAVSIEQRVADDKFGVETELDGAGMERRGTIARHVKHGGNGDTVWGDAHPEHFEEVREGIRAISAAVSVLIMTVQVTATRCGVTRKRDSAVERSPDLE